MNTRTILVALVVLGGTAWARAGHADEFVVEGALGGQMSNDDSYTALRTGRASPYANVAVAWGGLLGPVDLSFGLMVRTTLSAGTPLFDGALDVSYGNTHWLATAEYGPKLFRGWLRPTARLGVGYARGNVAIAGLGGRAFRDTTHNLAVQGDVGLELATPLTAKPDPFAPSLLDTFSIGLVGRLGYSWQTLTAFDELRAPREAYAAEDQEQPWSYADLDAGTIDPRGLIWSLGLRLKWR